MAGILNKIFKPRLSTSEDTRAHRRDNQGTNNLPSLGFHSVHGENIRISNDSRLAKRVESFCKGICFSNRPVKINERIYLRFADISQCWSGAVRFGFTANDPNSFRHGLPKYACPDLTNKEKNWAKALAERYAVKDSILFYYLREDGDVVYGIDGEEKGIFLSGVTTSQPVWALIDIYGNTCGIELLDMSRNRFRRPLHTDSSPSITPIPQPTLENAAIARENCELPPPSVYRDVNFLPLPFHRTRGCNIRLSNDRTIAERNDNKYCQGYVFTERPVVINEKLVVQIVQTAETYAGSLAFGVTSCNPATLNYNDLPEDPHLLLDRPEYWVVIKDVANSPLAGDELAFKITERGEVIMTKNRLPPITLMHVDVSQPLWLFFDLYGNTLKLKTRGIVCDAQSASHCDNTRNLAMRPHGPLQSISQIPNPSLSDSIPTQFSSIPTHVVLPSEDKVSSSSLTSPSVSTNCDRGTNSPITNSECTVCYEKPINSVLYNCGHMCMCYECAMKQFRGQAGDLREGCCPICRAVIHDVIKVYCS